MNMGGIDEYGSYLEFEYDTTRDLTGFMHCHLNRADVKNLAIFSIDDLIMFGKMIENSTAPNTSYAIYVTSSRGNYAIKVSDKQKFINSKNKILIAQEIYEANYEKYVKSNKHSSIQINGFLKFMQEIKIEGLELYSCDNSFKNWKNLKLDSEGKTVSYNC